MKSTQVTGLGDPEPVGKKILFQPPDEVKETAGQRKQQGSDSESDQPPYRVRTTIGLTGKALATIQNIQNQYRLQTGRVLPLWKLVSDAIQYYGESKEKANNPTYPSSPPENSDRGPTVQGTSRASLAQT